MAKALSYAFRMASKQRHDDYDGFSKWFSEAMIRRGYALEGPRAGGMTQLAAAVNSQALAAAQPVDDSQT